MISWPLSLIDSRGNIVSYTKDLSDLIENVADNMSKSSHYRLD